MVDGEGLLVASVLLAPGTGTEVVQLVLSDVGTSAAAVPLRYRCH